MGRWWLGASMIGLAAWSFGCSASSDDSGFQGAGGQSATSSAASGQGGEDVITGGGGAGGGLPTDNCTDAAKLIYVVGNGNELVSFHPPTLAFTTIGKLACPVQGGPSTGGIPTPFSMAVDRTGSAWVLYDDGNLFRVDVNDASCKGTSYVPEQLSAYKLFGMGFVSDSPGSNAETLYLGSFDGDGIATLNLGTLAVKKVGYYDALDAAAELTGTGDARLFGFFLTDPVVVAEIDKSTSDIISQAPQAGIDIGVAWAFAFWGGDFYLFTSPDGGTSRVDKYSPATGQTTPVLDDIGFEVVGAGVSTCAPVEPPK